MYAKYLSILSVGALIFFGFYVYHAPDTSINTLRAQAQESRDREEASRRDREAREDQLSQALYDECYTQALTLTGMRFRAKQNKAYECWNT